MPSPADTAEVRLDPARDAELDLHEAGAEQALDGATLAELDDLLLDPVDLNSGDLERLRAVPWLPPTALAEVRRARPLPGFNQLESLPRWDEALARSIRPFVRLDARQRPPAHWQAELQALARADRREIRVRATGPGSRLAMRMDPDDPARRSGHFLLQSRTVRAVFGDLRLGVSQGLVWWSSESDLRAASAPYRSARGLVGSEGSARERVIRGAGVEVDGGRWRGAVAAGEHASTRLGGGALALATGHGGWIEAVVLSAGGEIWSGFGLHANAPGADCAVEITTRTPGFAMAGSRRWARTQLDARIQATEQLSPFAYAGRAGRVGAARHGVLRASRQLGGLRVATGLAQGSRRDSVGTRIETREELVDATVARGRTRLEVRVRQRRVGTSGVGVESAESAALVRARHALFRLSRWFTASTTLRFEYRAVESADLVLAAPAHTGSAWQFRVEHSCPHVAAVLALTSFAAPSGLATPVVPEPGITGGAASVRLHGDGLRAAAAVQLSSSRIDWRLRVGHTLDLDAGTDTNIETWLRIHWP